MNIEQRSSMQDISEVFNKIKEFNKEYPKLQDNYISSLAKIKYLYIIIFILIFIILLLITILIIVYCNR